MRPLAMYKTVDSVAPTDATALDAILGSISRNETKRKPSAYLHEAFFNLQKQQKIVDLAHAASVVEESPHTSWKCRGCGETDRSKLQESSDKSGLACSSCGAIDTTPNFQEKSFDTENRTTSISEDRLSTDLSADEFKNSAARRRARMTNQPCSRNVPSALRSVQEKITRESTAIDSLHHKDRKRLDKAIVHVHSVFSSSGCDPDTNPLCSSISNIVTRVFVKTSSHALFCPHKLNCFTSMSRSADPKLVANACIKRVIDEAHKMADEGLAFEQIGVFEVRQMTAKLLEQLVSFTKCVSITRDSMCAIGRILDAAPEILCTTCKEMDYDDDNDEDEATAAAAAAVVAAAGVGVGVGDGGGVGNVGDDGGVGVGDVGGVGGDGGVGDVGDVGDENEQAFSSVDEFLQKLAFSIEASKQVGWIDEETAEVAQKHAVGIACFEWISRNSVWPPDLVSSIINTRVVLSLKKPSSNMRKIMKKIAKRYRISNDTVQREFNALPAAAATV